MYRSRHFAPFDRASRTLATTGAIAALCALVGSLAGCPDQLLAGGFNTPCTSDSQCLEGQWCDVDKELCMGEPIVEAPDGTQDGGGDATPDFGGDGLTPPPACSTTADCWPFEDGDLCNGFMLCQGGQCVLDQATVVVCPAGPECEPNVCNPDSGYCEATVIPGCADTPCTTPAQCPAGGPCQVAACVQGKCGFGPLNCDDGDECTDDFCDNGCRHVPNNNDVCVEPPECEFAYQCKTTGNALCVYADCVDGKCVDVTTPTVEVCNDGQDNDCDGLADCADTDCAEALACGSCSTTPVSLKCDAWTSVSGLWSGAGIGKYSCADLEMPGDEIAFSFQLPYAATVQVTVRTQPEDAWFMQLVGSCTGAACVNAIPVEEVEELPLQVAANTPVYFALDHPKDTPVYEAEVYVECPKQEICQDFFDNDGDGDADCADSDCAGVAPCQTVETLCNDGIDNDGDGYTDCQDPNCDTPCLYPENCSDLVDNDGDGAVDCADSDCADDPECQSGLCDAPVFDVQCNSAFLVPGQVGGASVDTYPCLAGSYPGYEVVFTSYALSDGYAFAVAEGTQGLPVVVLEGTCDTKACVGASDPAGGAAEFYMESGKQYFFAVESLGSPELEFNLVCNAVPGDEICNDGFDNDGDGAVDCDDGDCANAPECGSGQCQPIISALCGVAQPGPPLQGDANFVSSYACAGGNYSGNEVVQEFVALQDGPIAWTSFSDDGSALAFVLEGECTSTASCLAVAPTFTGEPLLFYAEAGKTYYLVVDSEQSDPTVILSDIDCQEETENCFDGFDNDGDGLADCADSDCANVGACQSFETECADGFDNDGNGLVDCQEPWCQDNSPTCKEPEQCNVAAQLTCFEGVFEPVPFPTSVLDQYSCLQGYFPGNETVYQFTAGSTGTIQWYGYAEPFDQIVMVLLEGQCTENTCVATSFGPFEALTAQVEAGKTYYLVVDSPIPTDVYVYDSFLECFGPENCTDGQDNDGDGQADCADSDCAGQGLCQAAETDCIDGFDNDGDGQVDCQEVWCKANSPLCGFSETCGDGFDNDGDGYEDCEDAECVATGMCPAQACGPVTWSLQCNEPNFEQPFFGDNAIAAYNCSQEQMPGLENVFDLGTGLDGPVSFSGYTDFQGSARAMLLTDSCGSQSCQQIAFQDFQGQLSLSFLADPNVHYWIVVDSIQPWEVYMWETSLVCL